MLNSVLNSASVLNSPFVYDKIKTNKETNVIEIKKKNKILQSSQFTMFCTISHKAAILYQTFPKNSNYSTLRKIEKCFGDMTFDNK